MKEDIKKKNIRECSNNIQDHLNDCYEDMSRDNPFEIKLKNGQALYCEKCHLILTREEDIRLDSYCKESNNSLHDLVIVEDCSERIVFGCAECGAFWWYSCKSKEECLHNFLEEPCKTSKDGKHVPVELLYLTGRVISKPVIEREVCLSVKEANRELDPVQLHSVK